MGLPMLIFLILFGWLTYIKITDNNELLHVQWAVYQKKTPDC